MFGFSGMKLFGMGLAVLAVVGVIYAGYAYVTGLQDKVETLTTNNTTLTITNDKLQGEIKTQKQLALDIGKERDNAIATDQATNAKLTSLRDRITSKQDRERQERLANSKKASLVLRITNNVAGCEWLHFDDYNGKCYPSGNFKEDVK